MADYQKVWAAAQKEFPNAQVVASTFDNYTQHLTNPAVRSKLPIVTEEVGDTWVYVGGDTTPPLGPHWGPAACGGTTFGLLVPEPALFLASCFRGVEAGAGAGAGAWGGGRRKKRAHH